MKGIALWIRHLAVLAMTVIAFANSYSHTVEWFQENGQEGTAHALAALPEVGLLVALLFLLEPLDRAGRFLVGALGFGSLALTITANLSHATDGVTRLAAIVAPAFTVFCAALEIRSILGHRGQEADPPVTLPNPEPVTPQVTVTAADLPEVKALTGGSPAQATTREDRAAWVRANGPMTLAEIQETFAVSDSTAKRIRQLV